MVPENILIHYAVILLCVAAYRNRTASDRGMNCTGNHTVDDAYEQFCDFDVDDLASDPEFGCTKKNSYGYNNNKPCVLLKINKV